MGLLILDGSGTKIEASVIVQYSESWGTIQVDATADEAVLAMKLGQGGLAAWMARSGKCYR